MPVGQRDRRDRRARCRRVEGRAPRRHAPGTRPGPGRGRPRARRPPRRRRTGCGCGPTPRVEGPADELRVGKVAAVAQLRVPPHGEVVDGDHPGGAAGRRHDVVGAVHDVDVPRRTTRRPGTSSGRHSACSGRAGMARCRTVHASGHERRPTGHAGATTRRRRARRRPGEPRARRAAPAQNTPTPVRAPSSGVASTATASRARSRVPDWHPASLAHGRRHSGTGPTVSLAP